MNVLDLFSGIGGFSLGLERAGMQTVAFCEIDPFCRAVLRKHWPDVPIYEDVRTLDADRLGRIDLVCGGYPCQPFSQAGKRLGEEDDRHLWPEMHRIVAELRPAWVLGENVIGHRTMGLDAVLSDLEASGYTARVFDIPAVAIGARHLRHRLWIVAHTDSSGGPEQEPRPECSDTPHAGNDGQTGALADAHKPRLQGYGRLQERPDKCTSGTGRRPVQGAWEPEPSICRVAHGVPNRVDRLKALGNAVVPQIPEIIGRAIIAAEEEMKR